MTPTPVGDGAKGTTHTVYEMGSTATSTMSLSTTADSTRRNSDELDDLPDSQDVTDLHKVPTTRTRRGSHMGEALENLASSLSHHHDGHLELDAVPSRRSERSTRRSFRHASPRRMPDLAEEAGSPSEAKYQGIPPEIGSFTAEVIFVFVCSAGLMLFSFLLGDITVNQEEFKRSLGISNSELPWLLGAYTTPLSLSVVISGSLSDLAPPRMIMVCAFAWLLVWNIVGVFATEKAILFYIVRAMQGLAIGVLVSGSMSILGRVYKPGRGALKSYLYWIFGSNAILSGICLVAAYTTIPPLRPVADIAGTDAPTIRDFDFIGAGFAVTGCICLLFGLTQGSVVQWSPYTYALVVVGILLLIAFFFVERWVSRPLIPNSLWKTKGFTPLMVAYFLGYGAFSGAWQFYAVQFWLRIQNHEPLTVALYLLPNAIVGVLATWLVSKTLHIVPGHFIYLTAMFAFALGPVFFLPQTSGTTYWALSLPGIALVTFGPDLSFAAASIYITSNVPRSYQGSAGSLLVTMQNLSSAVMTAVADAVGTGVDRGPSGDIGLEGLRAIWWFALACEVVAGCITLFWVRIPKEEEKEHVT
ncbi:hypothetical protein N7509_001376 [Penicillium cosmopolitanum]|uniref:Major facilitator superfamily (MFS) profile domain-containing protein n=1 Tax=Penicillium cosmopolitanum TaxID=1131564 RepID=A0A9W9WCN2_9EURO|nr:uncharacterized protein N7509_001376 [Penicillium cosmopolitanum]KAJ5414749.1 hypothetical protein N7509_001376 [Penicillium cosmopolitanum]